MRQRGDRWHLVPPRRYARFFVLCLTLLAIATFSWSMRPAQSGKAVVRVSLDRVPEEGVVTFAHSDTIPQFVLPVPVEELTDGPDVAEIKPATQPQGRSEPVRITTARSTARMVKPDRNGILPIGYSLTEGVSSQAGGVGVAKTIASEQGQATGLTIFLIGGSVIEVDRNELVAALAQLGASDKAGSLPPSGESGRLSLDRVRTAGLDLRYDAIHDRLVLKP